MIPTPVLFALVITLVISFALTNGFLDGGGIVSTVITTRALEPLAALCVVAACEILGVLLLGHAVVRTMGLNMVFFPVTASSRQVLSVLLAAMIGALAWNSTMWRLSFPSSSGHALLGGLLGATWQRFGHGAIAWPVVIKILISLALIPFIAALASYLMSRALYWAGQYMTPAFNGLFRVLQISALAGLALVHGSNDGQKCMALILLAMIALGSGASNAHLPTWVGLLCGSSIGLGVIVGSRRTIRTVGRRFYRIHNLQGLCAETAAMFFVGACSLTGIPMSSSHVMSSAVLGTGAAVHPRGVRWDLAGTMGLAWLFTIPASAGLSALLSYVVSKAL